jgi:hypothetical protein
VSRADERRKAESAGLACANVEEVEALARFGAGTSFAMGGATDFRSDMKRSCHELLGVGQQDVASPGERPEQSGVPTFSVCGFGHSEQGSDMMKKTFAIAVVASLVALSACNSSPREQAADNIEANAEGVADNLEATADNIGGDAALENQADAVRATGENQAEDMRTNDPDTNLSNGL